MNHYDEPLNEDEQSLLRNTSVGKLLVPVVLGIGAVIYLMSKQLDFDELSKIKWDLVTLWWLLVAVGCYILRHVFYTLRLMDLSDGFFSFKKSLQLITIWEFSSAASPTSVGGAGVALLLLSQEKLSAARTVTIVLYTLVIDTLILVVLLPLMILLVGANAVRPELESIFELSGYGLTCIVVLLFMLGYGFVFYYGLFINPKVMRKLLYGISKLPVVRKWQVSLQNTAEEIVVAAAELRKKDRNFHLRNLGYTAAVWLLRFLALNAIIYALVPQHASGLYDQLVLLGRAVSMYVITAFSPTPGGAGIAEYLFGGFYSDYVPKGVASIVALVWRLITYYPYLMLGAVVIPVWLRTIIKERRKSKQDNTEIEA